MQVCWLRLGTNGAKLATLVWLACGVPTAQAAPAILKDPPEPLPKEIVVTWQKAGADAGWMGVNRFGYLVFDKDLNGLANALPAFHFPSWVEGAVSDLPAPGAPFGLDLGFTDVAKAGLKDLVKFKDLQLLDLRSTSLADGGLKELAGLTSLKSLNLGFTHVTDSGLKELAALQSLQSLNLGDTRV